MSKQTIKVVARVIACADKIPQVQAILQKIVAPTRQEAGCLSHQLFSNDGNPVEFLFIEEWADENAIVAHFGMPHIQQALAEITPLLWHKRQIFSNTPYWPDKPIQPNDTEEEPAMAATGRCAYPQKTGAQPVYHTVLSAISGVTVFRCLNQEARKNQTRTHLMIYFSTRNEHG